MIHNIATYLIERHKVDKMNETDTPDYLDDDDLSEVMRERDEQHEIDEQRNVEYYDLPGEEVKRYKGEL
jgi:hypothetical protein